MLRALHISGLGVIDDLDLELDPGLNVLTGETGTGKTMVTVGLALALGARASSSLVREGARAARVQAMFDGHGAVDGLDEWTDDGDLLLARSVRVDGRSTVRIGGQLATAAALSELGSGLVEIHGQHHGLRLLEPATQTAFLDRFAGDSHAGVVLAFRDAYEHLRAAQRSLDDLGAAAREREREIDLLGYQVQEIEHVGPRPGETKELATEEGRLGSVERLLELAATAAETIGADGAAADALQVASAAIDAAADLDTHAAELASRARSLATEAVELARDLRSYRESLTPDPSRLHEIRDRLAALRQLQRKYGDTDSDVLTFLDEASTRLHALAGADERLADLHREVAHLGQQAAERAAEITDCRAAAAPRLAAAIAAELRELGMPGAVVEIRLATLAELGPWGSERVELRFTAGDARAPVPLAQGASGGELSRVMLACRSVLADIDDVPTLVFDEVDAGIGGQAGLAVGRRLARLASDRQVLVVTHLPQIACFADRHVRVRKTDGVADVEVLDDDERVLELSRMLAGLEATEHAVSHAEELLVEAAEVRATSASAAGSRIGRRPTHGADVT